MQFPAHQLVDEHIEARSKYFAGRSRRNGNVNDTSYTYIKPFLFLSELEKVQAGATILTDRRKKLSG
jgi:hypothetical protein